MSAKILVETKRKLHLEFGDRIYKISSPTYHLVSSRWGERALRIAIYTNCRACGRYENYQEVAYKPWKPVKGRLPRAVRWVINTWLTRQRIHDRFEKKA